MTMYAVMYSSDDGRLARVVGYDASERKALDKAEELNLLVDDGYSYWVEPIKPLED